MFDNGVGRAIPPAAELPLDQQYSRAVEFVIDETAHTIRQTWSNGGPDDVWFSNVIGDADPMAATGNVLICDGARRSLANGAQWSRIFEVTREHPPQTVFQIRMQDLATTNPVNWTCYRAERLPSVYP